MRMVVFVLVTTLVGSVGPPATADSGPPYDYASGLADAGTGIIGALMARTGAPLEHELPALQAGETGLVGTRHAAPAHRVQAWALIDTAQVTAFDSDAAVCIRISAPASQDTAELPNTVEGGGPVCEFLSAGTGAAHRTESSITIRTFADLAAPRTVGVEVFASWRQPHPREDGATATIARVHTIGFSPA